MNINGIVYALVKDGRGYVIATTSDQGNNFSESPYKGTFDEILQSFEFK